MCIRDRLPSPASWLAGAGPWPSWTTDPGPGETVGQETHDDQEQASTRQGRSSAANGLPVLLGVNVVHARCAARAPRCPLPRTGRNRLDRGTTRRDPEPPPAATAVSLTQTPKQPDQEDEEAAA